MASESRSFEVTIKSISEHPVVSLGDALSHEVVFTITSLEGEGASEYEAGALSGEELKRSFALYEKAGIKIERSSAWCETKPADWLRELVYEALDRSVSESA